MTDNVKSIRKVMQDGNKEENKSVKSQENIFYIYRSIKDQSLFKHLLFESDPDVWTAKV